MAQPSDPQTSAASTDEPPDGLDVKEQRGRLNWIRHLSLRNILGIGLAMILLVLFLAVNLIRPADQQVQCVDTEESDETENQIGIRTAEIEESKQILAADLRTQIQVNRGRIAGVEAEITRLGTRSEDLAPPTTVPQPATTVPQPATTVPEAQIMAEEQTAEIKDEVDDAIDVLEAEVQRLEAEIKSDEDALAALDDGAGPFDPPRSSVILAPRDPVAKIDLGSDRDARRVEIVLEPTSTARSEARGEPTAAEGGEPAESVELPAKPIYLSAAGQFRRSSGAEIPPEQVTVWARRFGSTVLLNVCISPTNTLDAGEYTGDVYLIDPALNQVRVPVEVTAQSTYLNWLFVLLLVSPTLSFIYVWFTSRHLAGADPWDADAFRTWATDNLILSFTIGFAAVWATLAVPFSNPTWGASVLNSLAVVGVGLVAAVTAMTAVTGRVREPEVVNGQS